MGALCAPSASASAEDGCVDVTQETPETLLHYRFASSSQAPIAALDRDRRYRVGEIRIVRQPIFDASNPHERRALYQAADRLHVRTRESTIRTVLLFSEGDLVAPKTLAESERRMRAKVYLADARVLPRRVCGERLDVDVVTRDVWTLSPGLDYGRAGGSNSTGLGLSEENLLGYGQSLEFGYSSNADRAGYDVTYHAPNLGASQVGLFASVHDNDDGYLQVLDVSQPFYSLEAPFALGTHFARGDAEESLFFRGDEVAHFDREMRRASLSGGILGGRFERGVWRWTGGFQYEDDRFGPVRNKVSPDPFPEDRTFAYPFFGFEYVEDRYAIATDVNRIAQTEDLDLGRHASAQIGFSTHAFGGDDQARAVYQLAYGQALRRSPTSPLTVGFAASGFWNFDRDRSEDLVVETDVVFHHRQTEVLSLASTAIVVYANNLYADHQVLVGGDTGLRGYPSRYQAGDRSFVVSVEERYRAPIYLWHLFRIGFAAFVDAGRAWFGGDPSQADYGVLVDAGVGLRIESTRTRRDQIFHLDFGVPLVDGPNLDAVQISFTVRSLL